MSKTLVRLPEQITASADYTNLVDLLAVLSEATDQKNALHAQLNQDARSIVDEHREEIVYLETTIRDSEQSIEALCLRHPEWFKKARTLKTPYGSAGFRSSSKLNALSEDAAITLLRHAGRSDLIRQIYELDLEALEKLDDAELAKFGIVRVKDETFAVKPGKVELGKGAASEAGEAQVA